MTALPTPDRGSPITTLRCYRPTTLRYQPTTAPLPSHERKGVIPPRRYRTLTVREGTSCRVFALLREIAPQVVWKLSDRIDLPEHGLLPLL